MHLLPTSLRALSPICASSEHSRFGATTGIQLECKPDNTYTATATDGRRLVVVEGSCKEADYPHMDALAAAPNTATTAVIPAKAWKETLTKAEKIGKGRNVHEKFKETVAVVLGDQLTSFGATNLEQQMFEQTRNVGGKFPNWRQVVPIESKAEYRINVDPILLAEVLKAVSDVGCDEETKRVVLHFHGNSPMVITARRENGPKVTGVVVPLCGAPTGNEGVKLPKSDLQYANGRIGSDKLVEFANRECIEMKTERNATQHRFDKLVRAMGKLRGKNLDMSRRLDVAERGEGKFLAILQEKHERLEFADREREMMLQLLPAGCGPVS